MGPKKHVTYDITIEKLLSQDFFVFGFIWDDVVGTTSRLGRDVPHELPLRILLQSLKLFSQTIGGASITVL